MAVKEVHGPGPRGARGPRPKVENPGKLLKRIMDEVFRNYLPHCILVLVCIVVSALANVQASLFLQTLMDDYIVPMTRQQNPSFAPLAGALVRMCCIYLVGILAAWANARIMVNVTQGTLRNLRTELFTHMESLPIRYFDAHPHGDIMSVYTNDVDTLRQMLSQSIPQLVSSVITIVSVFFSMCMLSWQLTIVTMLMVALMLFCSKQIAKSSSKYFIQQQRDLGKVNGYIEEMMEGQKVVKVFTHEQQTLAGFRELNDQLKESAKQANAFSNIMMPVNAQLGNISYAICALTGAAMAVGGVGGMTLGTVVAFLSLNKGFNMPISQVSMQANSVIMALAGAERIFKMMDEPSETRMEQYESYVSDQFAGRDFWVMLKSRVDLLAGKRKANGVFKGKDHYLLEDIAKPDEDQMKENLSAMKMFQKQYKDIPMYMMLVPNAANIESDKLPGYAVTENQEKQFKAIHSTLGSVYTWVDVSDILKKHRSEEIYYHTDHHWTTLGAYYGYQALSKSMKLDTSKTSDMKPYAVTNAFNGTLASTSGYETGYEEPIYIYAPDNLKNATEAVVNNVNEKKKTASLYDTSKLKGKDKYALFLGGNYPILDIKTTADSTDRLLIIKDSYANSLIPFLIPYYREIVVVDPRYYYDDIEKVMKKDNITSVLFLYNGNTFVKDNSISGVLQND